MTSTRVFNMYSKQHQLASHMPTSSLSAFAYDSHANCLYASKPPHHTLFDACRLTSFSDVSSTDAMYTQMLQAGVDARMQLPYPASSSLSPCNMAYQQQSFHADNSLPAHLHSKRNSNSSNEHQRLVAQNQLFSPHGGITQNTVGDMIANVTSPLSLKNINHEQQQWLLGINTTTDKLMKNVTPSLKSTSSRLAAAGITGGGPDHSAIKGSNDPSSSSSPQTEPNTSSSSSVYFPWMKTTKSHARQWKAHWLGRQYSIRFNFNLNWSLFLYNINIKWWLFWRPLTEVFNRRGSYYFPHVTQQLQSSFVLIYSMILHNLQKVQKLDI